MGTRAWGLGTWGRETRDLRTSSMGRGDVWEGDAETIMIIEKVGGKFYARTHGKITRQ